MRITGCGAMRALYTSEELSRALKQWLLHQMGTHRDQNKEEERDGLVVLLLHTLECEP